MAWLFGKWKNESKSDLEIMKEKFESGEYICLHFRKDIMRYLKCNPSFDYNSTYKLIHKKHKDILDAYLEDNSVEIEFDIGFTDASDRWIKLDGDFIEEYYEHMDYQLKPKEEYPQFRANSEGEVYRFDSNDKWEVLLYNIKSYTVTERYGMLNLLKDSSATIPYNKERGLYHKQPVWCWENSMRTELRLRFYDATNNCTFSYDGYEDGANWDNIEPVALEQLKTMPFVWEMYKQLKD